MESTGWPTGGAQAWRSPGHDKGPSSEACCLGVRLSSLTMALRPPPELVNSSMETPKLHYVGKLKHGNPRTWRAQAWPTQAFSYSSSSPTF